MNIQYIYMTGMDFISFVKTHIKCFQKRNNKKTVWAELKSRRNTFLNTYRHTLWFIFIFPATYSKRITFILCFVIILYTPPPTFPPAQNHQSYLQVFCLLSNAIKSSLYAVQKQLKPHQRGALLHLAACSSPLWAYRLLSASPACIRLCSSQKRSPKRRTCMHTWETEASLCMHYLLTITGVWLQNKTADVKKPPT